MGPLFGMGGGAETWVIRQAGEMSAASRETGGRIWERWSLRPLLGWDTELVVVLRQPGSLVQGSTVPLNLFTALGKSL